MATRINVANVPSLVRPSAVEAAIEAATAMRQRAREAAEAVAQQQHVVDEAQQRDVEQAATAARAGQPLGQPAKALTAARDKLLLLQRDLNALRLASEQCDEQVAAAIVEQADSWGVELDSEAEQAREVGRAAIAALQDACARIGAATSAKNWLATGEFDRAPVPVVLASYAPSSRRRTANGEALSTSELLGYAIELIDPPPLVSTPTLTSDDATVATS
jgi:hypothetical protein